MMKLKATITTGQGIQGLKGDKGDKGDIGLQGIQGDKGIQGIQGIQGLKGDKGDKGDIGLQGIQGDKGDPLILDEILGNATTEKDGLMSKEDKQNMTVLQSQFRNSKNMSNSDINDLKTNGFYYGYTNMKNSPHDPRNAISTLEVIIYSGHWLEQRWVMYDRNGYDVMRFKRNFISGTTWTSWTKENNYRTTATLTKDLDDVTDAGYVGLCNPDCANNPMLSSGYSHITNYHYNNGGASNITNITQVALAYHHQGAGQFALRQRYNGVWTKWVIQASLQTLSLQKEIGDELLLLEKEYLING